MAAKLPYACVFPGSLESMGIGGGNNPCKLKQEIRKTLRVLDEQNAVSGRYKWYNLPSGLTSELLERMIYYRGQVAFFFMPANGQFYALPYALDGNLDCYGRYTGITPLPFLGSSSAEGKGKPWITGLRKIPLYDKPFDVTDEVFQNGCVLIKDYTPQESEYVIPRQILQEPILDAMSEAFPLARTSLIANSGIKGMRVQDESTAEQVKLASRSITHAALTGDPWVPIVGKVELQDLTNGPALKSEEYLIYMQALDNYRLSLLGLSSGGLFQKKSHMLEAEQKMNEGRAEAALNDGLKLRQQACDIINSVWGLGIWCELSESAIGVDSNGSGEVSDSKQPETIESSDNISSEEEGE